MDNIRVLMIDDNKNLVEMVKEYFKNDKQINIDMVANDGVEGIELIVKGDVLGKGASNVLDLTKIIYHIIGKEELEGIYEKAGDINGDKEIDGRDMTNLIFHIINKKGYEWEN